MRLDTHRLACALDGEITGRVSVLAPGPGHSRADRSLSIKIDPGAAHGFVVHSFAGDSAAVCRAHVLAALGIPASPNAHHQLRRSRRKSALRTNSSTGCEARMARRCFRSTDSEQRRNRTSGAAAAPRCGNPGRDPARPARDRSGPSRVSVRVAARRAEQPGRYRCTVAERGYDRRDGLARAGPWPASF